jgi:pimeloyl-ACP methyl ester carboxylesterase
METRTSIVRKTVAADGDVKLSYLEAGTGPTIVLLPGWSQTAEQYRYQLEGLSAQYRVIAFDHRGHGDSDKPGRGYRIARLAADLQNVLVALDLRDVTILGHSMGCSVLWCHFDLFGAGRIARYVFCDQATCLTRNPEWTDQQVADYGPIFTPDSVSETANALRGPGGAQATVGFLRSMVTADMPAEVFQWIVDMNMKMPRAAAADLLYNHCHQDWREVLPRIDRPTLFIGGKGSLVPHSCVRWEASQVPGARVEIFDDEEAGSHFMFIENARKFNALLAQFSD